MSVEAFFNLIWTYQMHLQFKCHEQDRVSDVYSYQQNTRKGENGFSSLSALDTK